jgi:hypothetical protein
VDIPDDIIEGKRSSKRGVHFLTYNHLNKEASFYSAFITATNHNVRCFHQSELPPPPKNSNQLKNHPYKKGFIQAAQKKYNTLLKKGIFKEVAIRDTKEAYVIPNIWVYTYKFNKDGFLEQYKA